MSSLTPALFVLLWSTGFIGAKYGLPYAEPFTFLALRVTIASVLLGAVALILGTPWTRDWRAALHVAIAGLLVHGGYLGGVFAAVSLGMGAAVVALIVGLQPLLTALLAALVLKEEVTPRQWLGLVLGLAGVVLVVWNKLGVAAGMGGPGAVPLAVTALVSITLGTLYQKRHGGVMALLPGCAVQYAASALLFWGLALGFETMEVRWTPTFAAALAWLVLALSVGAVFLLFLLIRSGRAAHVASLFYLTPPTTALMAWALFQEALPPSVLAGFVIVAVGVFLARR